MYEFALHRPATLEEAVALLRVGEDPKVVSGGQSLIPALKQRLASPSDLVDVTRIPGLKGIEVADGRIAIGAATIYAAIAESPQVRSEAPAIAALASVIADPQVRNRGTIGGSLANNDPSADFPAAALALGATVETTERAIPYADFIDGLFATTLAPDEIVTRILFPRPIRGAYEKIRHPSSRYAVAGAFAAETAEGWRVAVTGAGSDGVFRLAGLEALLDAAPRAPEPAEIPVEAEMMTDALIDADYRTQLVRVAAARAVARALAAPRQI